MSKPHLSVWQAFIKTVHTIGETQRLCEGGNYSRDLYPLRAILSAFDYADNSNAPESTEIALTSIKESLAKHMAYPGVQDAHDQTASSLSLLENLTPGLVVEGEGFAWTYGVHYAREDGSIVCFWDNDGNMSESEAILPTLRALVKAGAATVRLPQQEEGE